LPLAPMKKSYVQAGDGASLFYVRSEGSATARVVLVHSLAMDHAFCRPVIEALAGAASVIALDCRGHGASDKPRGPYTVELFSDDVIAVRMTPVGKRPSWPAPRWGNAFR
jgi:3-oxoadipate enol-lactonase